MTKNEWFHRLHGDDLHDLMIFLVERYVTKKGGEVKSTKDFKKRYLCPCEPDVYFEIETKLIEGNRRINQKALYVVEIETNPTKESVQRKWKQYKESYAGLTDLVIVVPPKTPSLQYDWLALENCVAEVMPI